MRMANRLPFTGLLLTSLTLILVPEAQAADPGFCRQYARAALIQVRGGLSEPACAAGMHGTRWSSDFAVHYEWCLGASSAAAGDETDARTRYLKGCSGR
jgi:hypothetical protein